MPPAARLTGDHRGLHPLTGGTGQLKQAAQALVLALRISEEVLDALKLIAQALGVYTGFYGAPRQYSLSVRYDF